MTAAPRPVNVCIATPEVVGPYRNGGIGTAYTALAESLASGGHRVTLLFLRGEYSEQHLIRHWISLYRDKGIQLVPLLEPGGLQLQGAGNAVTSYRAYQWLRGLSPFPFDVIHFPEMGGLGFYTVAAKRQGLAFLDTHLCIGTHGPHFWIKEANGEFLQDLSLLEKDFTERRSVAWADSVVSPSQYMVDWMRARGWTLPKETLVRPNILPRSARPGSEPNPLPIAELVFFGRLETRKGLEVFCGALDRLAGRLPATTTVSFLGRAASVGGRDSLDYLRERASRWPFEWRALTDRDQPQAMAYLKEGGRLAVIPSLIENSPYTVLECLGAGVPFLASAVGGIPELVEASDQDRVLFAPESEPLAAKIVRALESGCEPARPSTDFETNERAWLDWHEGLKPKAPRVAVTLSAAPSPRVSVCLCHFNRPHYLAEALRSLEAQTYANFEVVVVDDGSTEPEAVDYVRRLAVPFEAKGWRIVRQENRYLGAARNTAVRHARGEYLLFMDDDNVARPEELATFVAVAQRTGADILTCVRDLFRGPDPPASDPGPVDRTLFLGGAGAVGAFYNCFGDANALVRRQVFESVGGFTEDHGVTHEDWEFFARAVLAGFSLEVVPEPLYWYRLTEDSMIRTTQSYRNHLRSLRPYLDKVPEPIRDVVLFAQGLRWRADEMASNLHYYETRERRAPSSLDALLTAASVLAQMGRDDVARNVLERALALASDLRSPGATALALVGAGRVLAILGDREGSRRSVLDALKIARESGDEEMLMDCLLASGAVLGEMGDASTARGTLLAALNVARQQRNTAVERQASELLARL